MDTTQQDNSGTSSTNTTYARITNAYPSKKQAILLHYEEDSSLIQYVVNIGRLIGPENILSASKISKRRICIYLTSEKAVDQLLNNYSSIQVNGKTIPLKRLAAPSRRLIISNVHPCIPNFVLLDELRKLKIKTTSAIHGLHIGLTCDSIDKTELALYSHITSFRRGVYIEDDENVSVPESLLITHDNESYRIFITNDESKCYICRSNSHQAPSCPNVKTPPTEPVHVDSLANTLANNDNLSFQDKLKLVRENRDNQSNTTTTTYNSQDSPENDKHNNKTVDPASQENLHAIPTQNRNDPILNPSEDFQMDQLSTQKRKQDRRASDTSNSTIEKTHTKKPKADTISLPTGIHEAIVQFCTSNANIHKIQTDDLVEFVTELRSKGTKSINIKDYSDNVETFIITLKNLHGSLTHKGTKNRIKRVINLHSNNADTNEDTDESP